MHETYANVSHVTHARPPRMCAWRHVSRVSMSYLDPERRLASHAPLHAMPAVDIRMQHHVQVAVFLSRMYTISTTADHSTAQRTHADIHACASNTCAVCFTILSVHHPCRGEPFCSTHDRWHDVPQQNIRSTAPCHATHMIACHRGADTHLHSSPSIHTSPAPLVSVDPSHVMP